MDAGPLAQKRTSLWLAWLASPHRVAMWHAVRGALAVEPITTPEASAPEAPPEPAHDAAWDRALARHAHAARRAPAELGGESLGQLGIAWDVALADRAEQRRLAERAFVLGLSGADVAVARLGQAVEDDIAALARAAGLRLDALRSAGGTAARAAERLRDALLSEVELASGALRRRVDDKRELPAVAEWREWIAIRKQYESGVEIGGAEAQRLLFSRVKNDIWTHAYWLSSERSERTVANAMYAWLLAEAKAVGDTRAIEPLTGNVAATTAPEAMR